MGRILFGVLQNSQILGGSLEGSSSPYGGVTGGIPKPLGVSMTLPTPRPWRGGGVLFDVLQVSQMLGRSPWDPPALWGVSGGSQAIGVSPRHRQPLWGGLPLGPPGHGVGSSLRFCRVPKPLGGSLGGSPGPGGEGVSMGCLGGTPGCSVPPPSTQGLLEPYPSQTRGCVYAPPTTTP